MAAPAAAPRRLLVLDLDGFKAVNDVAGHEVGDQLLVEVARRLHTVVREDDPWRGWAVTSSPSL